MLKYSLILCVSLAGPVWADALDDYFESSPAKSFSRSCEAAGSYASAVMMARQWGKSPSALIKEADPEDREFVRELVTLAYDVPRYSSLEVQGRAEENFRNEVEIRCMRAFSSK